MAVTTLPDNGMGTLFKIKAHVATFTLKGQSQGIHADSRHITLADVVPENGVVVLSLHYQAGMRALPTRVQIERERYPYDPIAFLRLRGARPLARGTLRGDD